MVDHKEHLIVLLQRAKAFIMLAQTELHLAKQYAEQNLEDFYELRVINRDDSDNGFDFLSETLPFRISSILEDVEQMQKALDESEGD